MGLSLLTLACSNPALTGSLDAIDAMMASPRARSTPTVRSRDSPGEDEATSGEEEQMVGADWFDFSFTSPPSFSYP